MPIDLKAVETLAADQASLRAAAGLAKPSRWSSLGISDDGHLLWGDCAGSGANPYRVMADLRDLGNKCTCPSRKFPCKHALALLWLKAEAVVPFGPAEPPAWVGDWLGRRRGGSGRPKVADAWLGEAKDVGAALATVPHELRFRLLGVLAIGLSEVDRGFLEGLVAADRAPKVKALAASLRARLGHGAEGGEDAAELASFFEVGTKGLLRRTRAIKAHALKTPAQHQRRRQLFSAVDLAGFAAALKLSPGELDGGVGLAERRGQ